MRSEENDRVVQALEVFRIEIPSWGFANTGTRFGKFTQAAAATTIEESSAMPATVVLTGLANAAAPKRGSEAHDTSKAAVHHLIRELAVRLGPQVRVTQALQKYGIVFSEAQSTEDLRAKLSRFYAQRTLTKRPILPEDCANAIVWLTSDQSSKTTGHVIPWTAG